MHYQLLIFFFLMRLLPPSSTRTYPLCPYPTLFRSPLAAEPEPVLAIAPIIRDGENRLDADFLAGDKVLFTMIGCHVDKARTGVRGDLLGSDEGVGLGEEALELVHRMASHRSGKLGAFPLPDTMFIGAGEIIASGHSRDQLFGAKNYLENEKV